MNEEVRNNYFVFLRLGLLAAHTCCGMINQLEATGVSLRILLLVSFLGKVLILTTFDDDELVRAVAEGLSNKEIAAKLFITEAR